jgi:tetratricopeptide (TPR) repeat protein
MDDDSDNDRAVALTSLGNAMSAIDHYEESLAAHQEALEIYQRLDQSAAAIANAKSDVAVELVRLDRYEEALGLMRDVAPLYRGLAAEDPAQRANLAQALHNLAGGELFAGNFDEALASIRESIAISQQIYREEGLSRADVLATSFGFECATLSMAGKTHEALTPAAESAQIYLRLATAAPDAYLPRLSAALEIQAACLLCDGRLPETVTATTDGIGAIRRLSPGSAPTNEVALMFLIKAVSLEALGQTEQAGRAIDEALAAYRELPADVHPRKLIGYVSRTARVLEQVGRDEEAAAARRVAAALGERVLG